MGRGGIEPPTHGFSGRSNKNVNTDKTKTCNNSKMPLTQKLTPTPKTHADTTDFSTLPHELTVIVKRWHQLPEHIKATIKTLVSVAVKENDGVV
jgi:hypothetical protein